MTNEHSNNGGNQPKLSSELEQFAVELSRVRPRDDRLDRERLAFLAGQASVAPAPSKPFKVLGLPLESRAWPTAFAAMTAVAATLLCMLLTRPESPGVSSIANDGQVRNGQRAAIERVGGRSVLTTSDVHSTDIETRLAKLEAGQPADESSVSPKDDFTRPVFTPSAWQQVIQETNSPKPLPRKSSTLSRFQGVNT